MRNPDRFDSISFVFSIALGVFIGALAAAFAYEAITALRFRVSFAEFEKSIKTVGVDAERTANLHVIDAQRKQIDDESVAQAKRAASEMVQRLERERAQRKATAWDKFYQPSPPCAVDSGTAQCANEFMAAKKRFEQIYVDR